jgi:hypothetical protein
VRGLSALVAALTHRSDAERLIAKLGIFSEERRQL